MRHVLILVPPGLSAMPAQYQEELCQLAHRAVGRRDCLLPERQWYVGRAVSDAAQVKAHDQASRCEVGPVSR